MRYWHPMSAEAADILRKAAPLDDIVLLPLYPHFSYATTLSSLKEWRRVYGPPDGRAKEHTVGQFYDHPLYIQAVDATDWVGIAAIPGQFADSSGVQRARFCRLSLVEKGDPYPKQIEATVKMVCEAGAQQCAGWPRTHLLCYQSRVGPAKWLQPPLTGTIERLGHEGVKEMLVVPISFVTEHIETLHEINIEARTEAAQVGIDTFRMMPAVGDSPLFIGALKDLVLRAVGMEVETTAIPRTSFTGSSAANAR